MIDIDPARFRELVSEALDDIPPDLGELMDNVNVFVDDESDVDLYGLYEGIPLTARDQYGGLVMPDKITIFRRTICGSCWSEQEVRDQVRVTVIHEVAHHFGIDDHRLSELGWA